MAGSDMPLAQQLGHLERLANEALCLWDLPEDARATLINVSENATYLVESPGGPRTVLRVHREAYHSPSAIACELAWSRALADDAVIETPKAIVGRNGALIQTHAVPGLPLPRHLVLFEFVPGDHPDENQDLVAPFEGLGQMAAKMHTHAIGWPRPGGFERLIWNDDTVFGPAATWGDWRTAPNVTPPVRDVLERVEQTVRQRLDAFGKGPDRYGLIHADMRLANLLVSDGHTRLIDFDDCGLGWFLYDFAAAISFMEDHPQVPALQRAWVEGYRQHRTLSAEDEREIASFVMLRRMALLAWIGSHIEAPEPQALAPRFAEVSAELGEAYLSDMA